MQEISTEQAYTIQTTPALDADSHIFIRALLIMSHQSPNTVIARDQRIKKLITEAGLPGETHTIPAHQAEKLNRERFIAIEPGAKSRHITIIAGRTGLPGQRMP